MIELLNKDLIKIGTESETKDEILNEIAEMVSNLCPLDQEEIYEALQAREELCSTGLGSNIAIPHCAFDTLDKFYIGLLITDGVDFDSLDGQPVKYFFFSIGSKSNESQHITTLTSISKLAMNKELMDNLATASNSDEVYRLLQ